VVSSVLSTEFASDLPLGAEDRETNAKRECLPLAAELLATSGTGKVAAPVSDTEKGRIGKDESDSRPVRRFLGHVHLLFGFSGYHAGLIHHDLSSLIVWRVAPRAELLGDAALAETLFDDLVERAAGVG